VEVYENDRFLLNGHCVSTTALPVALRRAPSRPTSLSARSERASLASGRVQRFLQLSPGRSSSILNSTPLVSPSASSWTGPSTGRLRERYEPGKLSRVRTKADAAAVIRRRKSVLAKERSYQLGTGDPASCKIVEARSPRTSRACYEKLI